MTLNTAMLGVANKPIMPSVTNKPIMLSVVMLSVFKLSVVAPTLAADFSSISYLP